MSETTITPAQRVAHDTALHQDPASHPTDCGICAALTEESTTVSDAEKLAEAQAAAETARTEAEEARARAEAAEKALAERDEADSAEAHAAAIAAKDAEIDAKDAELAAAIARAEAAEAQVTEIGEYLAAVAAEAEEAEAMKERKDKREAALDGLLTPERIAERIDAYAAMSDEDFEAARADLAALAGEKPGTPAPKGEVVPGVATASNGGVAAHVPPAQASDEDPHDAATTREILKGAVRP